MIEQSSERIKIGEENYRKFWKEYSQKNFKTKATLTKKERPEFSNSAGNIVKNNELRAVFLGIKPSAIISTQFNNFEEYGLKKIGDFIYDNELANLIIKQNKDVFSNVKNAEDFFKKIKEDKDHFLLEEKMQKAIPRPENKDKSWEEIDSEFKLKDLRTGLLLGFPRLSSEKFANNAYKECEKVRFVVGNIVWVSYPDIDQTDDKEYIKILKNSFEIANDF